MEAAAPPSVLQGSSYPDSVDSSPRSRNTDSWDEPIALGGSGAHTKLRLMCSYGGHIVPRPHDKVLCYLGGDTRIVVVDRQSSLADLSSKLSRSLLNGRTFSLKYQLPNEDLDSLISVTTDEDLENMIEEYDRNSASSVKPSRLRLFLFPSKPDSAASSSIGSLLDDSKSETWFVDALNGTGILPRGMSSDSASVDCLLGLDDAALAAGAGDGIAQSDSTLNKPIKQGQDVHSVPDSPMLENSSSFGSTSSATCLSNLPPIRVHVDDGGVRLQDQRVVGLEEQFSQMNVSAAASAAAASAAHRQDEGFKEGGFVLLHPPPTITAAPILTTAAPLPPPPQTLTISPPAVLGGENPNRVFQEEIRKPPLQKPNNLESQTQDPIARDNLTGMISRSKPAVFYQDPIVSMAVRDRASVSAGVTQNPAPKTGSEVVPDPNYRSQMQVPDQSYVLPMQQDQQQFYHGNPPPQQHFIHHPTAGPVQISSYYPMHPQQQSQQHQFDQQYPMYFLPIRQNQPYNLSLQSNLGEASPPIPSNKPAPIANPAIYATRQAPPKPDLYRTAAGASQPLVQVSDQQQQFMGYHHQMHHPSQSQVASGNFAYEFADPLHAQMYYTQQVPSTLPPQYQTMSSGAVLSENPSQLPTDAKLTRPS